MMTPTTLNHKNHIHILPENLTNKIAAGEVIERPASVVKELVENSIDAEATKITIHVEKGGKTLIRVLDNGCGMSEEDLVLAFERHATSKISSSSDLESIETLGFRGEALPSIASVSQIEVKSKRTEDTLGTVLSINGGKTGRKMKTAANTGTQISIKQLFFNTPARRKFLKADNSEHQQIVSILKRFFLAYPDIAFELWIDNKQVFDLKEAEIDQRIQEIFGTDIFKAMLPLFESIAGIELTGFISRPDVVRRSRGHQYLFLNGRPIQDKSLYHAVFQGYANLLSPGEFPIYCLFLEMEPRLFDVNVHPTKMEVRFSNDRSLYYLFMNAIKKTLSKEGVVPDMVLQQEGSAIQNQNQQNGFAHSRPREIIDELKSRKRSMARHSGSQLSLTYFETEPKTTEQNLPPESIEKKWDAGKSEDVSLWQLHRRYIVSEIKSGAVIIDQHVAHERVLFEKILSVLKKGDKNYGQKLLFPQKLTLAYDDFMIFKEIYEVLKQIGFSITVFSGTTIIIEAMPADVKVGRESQILLDIIDYYRNNPLTDFDLQEKMAAAYACKNAVKSGELLSMMEMHNLIDQLFACETPFFCPHGRPVIVTITLDELDKKFKRIT